ncbi:MAG: glycosyltransferase family 2 protein [bacterium]|nr:glycosyltransferase family 2 protein [bacterium]
MLVSIVVPVYNEEKLLPDFVGEVVPYLKSNKFDYELIFIENGSSDATLAIATKFAKTNKNIKVFHLPQAGYGLALILGCKKARGEFVVIYNADFWDPKFIELTKVNLLNYDIALGSKNLTGSIDQRPLGRKIVTKGFNLFLNILLGFRGTDTHGIKVFKREFLLPVIRKCKTRTGIFDTELIVRAQRGGASILELPVEVIEKRPNRFGLIRILKTPADILRLYFILGRS